MESRAPRSSCPLTGTARDGGSPESAPCLSPVEDRPKKSVRMTARDGRDNGNAQPLPQPQSHAVPEAESQEPVSEGIHE
jgi:hypothetical protein